MEITQFQMTLGSLLTILTVSATMLSFYLKGVRPLLKESTASAIEIARWRQDVEHRLETVESSDPQVQEALDQIQTTLSAILSRLAVIETIQELSRNKS